MRLWDKKMEDKKIAAILGSHFLVLHLLVFLSSCLIY